MDGLIDRPAAITGSSKTTTEKNIDRARGFLRIQVPNGASDTLDRDDSEITSLLNEPFELTGDRQCTVRLLAIAA